MLINSNVSDLCITLHIPVLLIFSQLLTVHDVTHCSFSTVHSLFYTAKLSCIGIYPRLFVGLSGGELFCKVPVSLEAAASASMVSYNLPAPKSEGPHWQIQWVQRNLGSHLLRVVVLNLSAS